MNQLPLLFDASKFRPEFADWLAANPHIWSRFCQEANAIWDRGWRHYGARTIIEFIRHQTALAEVNGEWKVNNNMVPDLARLYQDSFPERAGLFSLRLVPCSVRVA